MVQDTGAQDQNETAADEGVPGAVADGAPADSNRRRALMLGAAGVAAAVTVRPAFAATAASVLNCQIPVPANSANYVALDGTLVPPGTQGAFPPAGRPFRGEEVRQALQGRSLPGTTYQQGQAYMNYIRRLRSGQSGFTCFASIQMPR